MGNGGGGKELNPFSERPNEWGFSCALREWVLIEENADCANAECVIC